MRILKAFCAKGLAVALALSVAPAAIPSGAPVIGGLAASKAQAGDYYYVDGPGYYRGHRGWDGPRYHERRDRGDAAAAAIIGGIVGLGIGAAIASSSQPRYYEAPRYYEGPRYRTIERVPPRYYRPAPVYRAAPVYRSAPRYATYAPRPWTRDWYEYCSARYRSFDARSGTFQPYNGPRQLCR